MQPIFFMEWQSRLAVGNALIDQQRQSLCELCNTIAGQLVPAAKDTSDRLRQDMLQQLLSWLEACFRLEEQWLAASGYPLLARHVEEHDVYLAGLRNLVEQDRRGKTNPYVLQEWLLALWAEHMQSSDLHSAGVGHPAHD